MNSKKEWLGEDFANALGRYEAAVATGTEEARLKEPNLIRGKVTLRDVIRANKHVWLS